MEKAHKAVDAVVDGVKKVAIGSEKKPKTKKEKGGDGGAEGALGAAPQVRYCILLLTRSTSRNEARAPVP
jgi:threonyl-tRNA synthetase